MSSIFTQERGSAAVPSTRSLSPSLPLSLSHSLPLSLSHSLTLSLSLILALAFIFTEKIPHSVLLIAVVSVSNSAII